MKKFKLLPANGTFQRGGRAREDNASLDQMLDECAGFLRIWRGNGFALAVTYSQLLKAGAKRMFDVIYTEVCCLPTTNATQMSGHLEPASVGLFDHALERLTGDRCIDLERSDSFAGPIGDTSPGIRLAADDVVSDEVILVAVKEWPGDVHLRARDAPLVNAKF
jgi:hypothetical protein